MIQTLQLLALTTQQAVALLYIFYCLKKYGITESISATYYLLDEDKKPLFTLFTWGISFPLIVFALEPLEIYLLVAALMIAYVGAFAKYKEEITDVVHVVCATGGVIFSMVHLLTKGLWVPVVVFVVIGLLFQFLSKNKTYWHEILAIEIVNLTLIFTIYV